MKFVQLIDYETTREDEIAARFNEALESGEQGGSSMIRLSHSRDHDNPNHFIDIVEFTSYEDAMENSARPETDAMARDFAALCTSGPRYSNLDVLMEA